MTLSKRSLLSAVVLALLAFSAGLLLGSKHTATDASPFGASSISKEMDAYCITQLNDRYLSKLSPEARQTLKPESFFSAKLHTCVETEVTLDPKDAGSMNYVVSDLTDGFVAPPKWHHNDSPLHVYSYDYGSAHHLHAEGVWIPVSSDPGQQAVAEANKVNLTCDYTGDGRKADDANVCVETEGYTRFGSVNTDTQTFRIASWSPDEVIATDVERGLSGTTTATLLIHPKANQIEVVDRTNMDDKQPDLFKNMTGKSYGDHYELHGGMFFLNTAGTFFQCNEDGVVTDMRLDVVRKYHGDVMNVPDSEWNAGKKADHKFSSHECEAAMRKRLEDLR